MTADLLDGKRVASEIRSEVAEDVRQFVHEGGPQPCLTAVLVGEDPASQVYVRNKRRACEKAGIDGRTVRLDAGISQRELLETVQTLNDDPAVHGILVQLPLPADGNGGNGFDERAVLDTVAPLKDVDAFSPVNVGLLMQGRPRFLPCTPHGIQILLMHAQIPVFGQHVVIVGRSNIVGKPLAAILMQKAPHANATVTVVPSRYEGFGLPAIEALACGSPLLLAHTSSLPEVGGGAAAYFSPGDVHALAGELGRLLRDTEARSQMASQGLARARQFTWKSFAQSNVAAYESALA